MRGRETLHGALTVSRIEAQAPKQASRGLLPSPQKTIQPARVPCLRAATSRLPYAAEVFCFSFP